MADGLNQKINDHDSISTILSSDNFLNLDTNIQNRIIDTVHTDKEKDGGTMGKFREYPKVCVNLQTDVR